jgi:hypothetical protein
MFKIDTNFRDIAQSKHFSIKLYAFFWLLLFAIYWQTRNAGFVTDFYGWMTNFDTLTFSDCINGTNYGIKSFYQVTHLIMYALTYFFRTNGLPWFLIFVSLNALIVLFLYHFFTKTALKLGVENAKTLSFIGLLMFVASPYQAEVMVWRASFHYFLGFGFMLSILLLYLKYLDKPEKKYWWRAMTIFAVSIFSIEYFLFTPFLLAIFTLFWYLNAEKQHNYKDLITRFFLLPLILLAAYFVAYKSVNGRWIAHYGASSEHALLSLNSFSTYGKYFFKHLFFIRYLEHKEKEAFFDFFKDPSVSALVLLAVAAISFYGLIRFKKMQAKGRLLYLNFAFFSMLLAPAMTLFFSTVLLTENDRYGYLPSAFLMFGLVIALSYLPKRVFYAISICYILFSFYFLLKTTRMWHHAGNIQQHLVENYHWWTGENILFLNVPDDIKGMYIFRSEKNISGLAESVVIEKQRPIKARTFDVAQYNLTSINDGVTVKMASSDTVIVTLNQWGNWWWRGGIGASNYENEVFKVQFDYNGCGNCYRLILKDTTVKNTLIYQVGYDLKEVNF